MREVEDKVVTRSRRLKVMARKARNDTARVAQMAR
jgi:hypothetical protein